MPARNGLGHTSPQAFIEPLESRRLLANGISPEGAPTIMGTANDPLNNVLVADFIVTDTAGEPGEKWNAKILWGDGGQDQRVPAIMGPGSVFQFFGTHTYLDPGTFTITVQIAVPGSGQPLANVVTTSAIIQAVPEPGTLLLAAVAMPFLLQRRRDKARHSSGMFFLLAASQASNV